MHYKYFWAYFSMGKFHVILLTLFFYTHIHTDIYISCVSFAHNVCAKDYYLAMVSTNVETSNPEKELQPGLQLLGPIMDK